MGLFQGMMGNFSEVTAEELQRDYGKYLIDGENISNGFKLVRDTLIFTNLRVIYFDKQGATGKKMSVNSIYLDSICEVACETAGVGMDDSELTITYIRSPYRKAKELYLESKKFEFPKRFDVVSLYVQLENRAYQNIKKLNS